MAKAKDDLLMMLLLAFVLSGRGRAGPPAPALPSSPSSQPERVLSPGWWWSWLTNDEAPAYQAWWNQYRSSMAVRKTYGGPAFGVTIVLIEVFDAVPWTLARQPHYAPRGADTDLTDVAATLPSPPSILQKMVEQVAKQAWDYLKQLYNGPPPREPWPGTQ